MNTLIDKKKFDLVEHNGKSYIVISSHGEYIKIIDSHLNIYVDKLGVERPTPESKYELIGTWIRPSMIGITMTDLTILQASLNHVRKEKLNNTPQQLSLFDLIA